MEIFIQLENTETFIRRILMFLIFLLKTLIVCTRQDRLAENRYTPVNPSFTILNGYKRVSYGHVILMFCLLQTKYELLYNETQQNNISFLNFNQTCLASGIKYSANGLNLIFDFKGEVFNINFFISISISFLVAKLYTAV